MNNRWILGISGWNNLAKLNQSIQSHYLEKVNSKSARPFESYCPVFNYVLEEQDSQLYENPTFRKKVLNHPNDVLVLNGFLNRINPKKNPFFNRNLSRLSRPPRLPLEKDHNFYKNFENQVREAIKYLLWANPQNQKRLKRLAINIIPIETPPGCVDTVKNIKKHSKIAFSIPYMKGAIFHNYLNPDNVKFAPIEMAIDLAHEMGHQALMNYQFVDSIVDENSDQLVYSALMNTERPAILSLHAACALSCMTDFLLSLCESNEAKLTLEERNFVLRELKKYKEDLGLTLAGFDKTKFTDLGGEIYREFLDHYNALN